MKHTEILLPKSRVKFLVCPQHKDQLTAVMEEWREMFTFKKLESENFDFNYQSNCTEFHFLYQYLSLFVFSSVLLLLLAESKTKSNRAGIRVWASLSISRLIGSHELCCRVLCVLDCLFKLTVLFVSSSVLQMVPVQTHLNTVQYLDLLTASEAASHLPACHPHPYLRHTRTHTHAHTHVCTHTDTHTHTHTHALLLSSMLLALLLDDLFLYSQRIEQTTIVV